MFSYHIALAIEPFEVGRSYATQPLHCTLMHWFQIVNDEEQKVVKVCDELSQQIQPFELIITDKAMFGQRENTPVYTVHKSLQIQTAHLILKDSLSNLGMSLQEPNYSGLKYSPHITKKLNDDLMMCSMFKVKEFYLARRKTSENPPGTIGNSEIIKSFEFIEVLHRS